MSTNPDAKLLRIEEQFNAADKRRREVTAKLAEVEEEQDRLLALARKAEKKQDKKAAKVTRAFYRIMKTRAKSLDGLLVKWRVRKIWDVDDEDCEATVYESLLADLKAFRKAR